MARDLRLTDFEQSIEETGADDAYDIVPFAGDVTPLLVRKDNTFRILSQSGQAVAWDAYLNAPAPLFPDALIERPRVSMTRDKESPFAYRTTWSYVMALDGSDTYDKFAAMQWPADPATVPGFTEVP